MALVVEDGSIVEGSNSYVSVEEANVYFATLGNEEWTYREDLQEAALINASQRLDALYGNRFRGAMLSDEQSMMFPRTVFRDENGRLYNANSIPKLLKDSVCEYALKFTQEINIMSDEVDGVVKSESLSLGNGAYSESKTYASMPQEFVSRAGFLKVRPLLKASNILIKG